MLNPIEPSPDSTECISVKRSDVDDSAWSAPPNLNNNLNEDPDFRDVSVGNLRLRQCSPAINVGSNADIQSDDTDLNENGNPAESTPASYTASRIKR